MASAGTVDTAPQFGILCLNSTLQARGSVACKEVSGGLKYTQAKEKLEVSVCMNRGEMCF